MMNRFENKFGSPNNMVILMGDFSDNRPKKYQEPTKGKSIRHLFKNRGYELHLVNEFRTSVRLIESGEKLEKIRWDNKRNAEVHRLLGSKILRSKDMNKPNTIVKDLVKTTKYRPTIIHRDLNASLNIRHKGLSIIMGLNSPYYMERDYDRDIIKKIQTDKSDIMLPKIEKQQRRVIKTPKTRTTKIIRVKKADWKTNSRSGEPRLLI